MGSAEPVDWYVAGRKKLVLNFGKEAERRVLGEKRRSVSWMSEKMPLWVSK
jgi:hypothetical protein